MSLQQLEGSKVVVFFYEGASCGACQQQLTALQSQLPAITSAGGRVVAVSTDPLATSRSLDAQLHLGFPILYDQNHALGAAFRVFDLPSGMNMGPVDSHSIFVLNRAGKVSWKELAPDTMNVPVDQVVTAVRAAS